METTTPKWIKGSKGVPFTGIGSLEADILAIIWEAKRVTVRDIYETLREQRQIAYTTVMTVMNNLVKKELLTQDRSSAAYIYTPAIPGDEVASTILDSIVQRLSAVAPTSRFRICWDSRTTSPPTGRRAAQLRREALRRLRACGSQAQRRRSGCPVGRSLRRPAGVHGLPRRRRYRLPSVDGQPAVVHVHEGCVAAPLVETLRGVVALHRPDERSDHTPRRAGAAQVP